MELSFYSEPRGVFQEKLKGFWNTVTVRVGWSVSPGAVFIAQCSRWLFRSLLSEVGKWMVPTWGGIIILDEIQVELEKLKTPPRKPAIRLSAHSASFDEEPNIFKITLRFWFKDAENPVCRCLATDNSSDTVFLWGYVMLCCTGSKTPYWSLTARGKCFILQFKMLWNRQKQACLIN